MSASLRILGPLVVIAVGILGAVTLVATGPEVKSRTPEPLIPLVRTVIAEPADLRHVVVTHGTVEPRTESELVPEVSGRIEWLAPSFASGGFFAADEPLLRIEAGDYRIAQQRAEASLARARSERSRAQKELERQERLAAQDVASDSRLDDARNAETVSEAVLAEAQAALEQARRDHARTEIRAPFDGRVRSERADVGQFVNRGAPIATIYAVDFAEVRLPVPDAELAFLDLPNLHQRKNSDEAGPEVKLRAEFAGARHTWTGRIVRMEGEIDPKTRMVHVVARVPNPYGESAPGRPPLAAGLFVEAEIAGLDAEGVFVLPRGALRNGNRVWIVDGEGRLRWREVVVARTESDQVIVSDGLKAGERVCVSALESAVEGQQVRVAADEPKAAPTDETPEARASLVEEAA